MVPAHPLRVALVVLVAVLAACGGDDSGGDRAEFCRTYDGLRNDDPFERLDVASPGEMRDAFRRLHEGARDLEDLAPSDVAVQADRYDAAVGDLVDQLRGAGFDLRNLDLTDYRQATDAYNEAAVSLENAAAAACG